VYVIFSLCCVIFRSCSGIVLLSGGSSQGSTPVKTGSPAGVAGSVGQSKSEAALSPLRASSSPNAPDMDTDIAIVGVERGNQLHRQISRSADSSLMAAWRGYAQVGGLP
jgi:hypothetical protein